MPKRGTTATDIVIGERIRHLRKARRASQTEIGAVLGVKYTQIQKFELGANRLSASQLFELAQYFNVPVAALLPAQSATRKVAEPAPSPAARVALEFAASKDGFELMRVASALDPVLRTCLITHAKMLAKKLPKKSGA